MRLLFVSPSFFPATYYGGPIYSTYEFTKALKKSGIDIHVVTTDANGKERLKLRTGIFHKLETELPVKYYKSLDSRGTSVSMMFNLWRDMKDNDLIYLVSIFSPPTPIVLMFNIFFKKPIIISPRGQLGEWSLKQGNIFKKTWLNVFISPLANKIHWEATSLPEKNMIIKVYPQAEVEVLPSILKIEDYEIKKVRSYEIYEKLTCKSFKGKKIMVSMGRLHKVKGFDILIEAMNILDRDDLALLIAGEDFGERKNLEQLIDKLGLKEKVFLIGMIEGMEKIAFLRNADVFSLASHHENFGIVYAEALAAGTPIVASTNTPWQDVEKYNCGKWVENNSAKFAEAITEILNSDSIQMGKNGSDFISEYFSWDKLAKAFIENAKRII